MNDNGMIKQYLILAALLIVGAVILTSIDFGGGLGTAQSTNQTVNNAPSKQNTNKASKRPAVDLSKQNNFSQGNGQGTGQGTRQGMGQGMGQGMEQGKRQGKRQGKIGSTDLRSGSVEQSGGTTTKSALQGKRSEVEVIQTTTENLFQAKPTASSTASSTPFQSFPRSFLDSTSASSTSFYERGNSTESRNNQNIFASTSQKQGQDSRFSNMAQKANNNQSIYQSDNKPSNKQTTSEEQEPNTANANEAVYSSDIGVGGRVLDNTGHAVVGLAVTIKLKRAFETEANIEIKREFQTRTNEKGSYYVDNLIDGQYSVCTAEANGFHKSCLNVNAPHQAADFTLKITANGKVTGVVENEQGVPVAEVAVSGAPNQRKRTVTDEKGRFELPMSVSSEFNYQLFFSKKEFQSAKVSVRGADILQGKNTEQTVQLKAFSGFDVRGTVRDQSGNAVAGQYISLHSSSVKSGASMRARTDINGAFIIKHVNAALDYRANVSPLKAGYVFDAAQYGKLEISEGMQSLNIELENIGTGNISTQIRSPNGEGLANQTFSIRSGASHSGRASTDENGYIEFKNVTATRGKKQISISSMSSTPSFHFSGISLDASEFKTLAPLMVDKGDNSLDIFVIDENQNPIGAASGVLSWTQIDNGITSKTRRSAGKTSDNLTGIISFTNLSTSSHFIQVNIKGYKPYSAKVNVNQKGQQFDVVLSKR